MPSLSPGNAPTTPTPFVQILPGAPANSLQSIASFVFRHKRFVAYISGSQLSILSGPTVLVRALAFNEELVAVAAEARTGKIVVASKSEIWVLEPETEGWTRIWWEKVLFLRRDDPGDEARWLSWGIDGELLVGGSRKLSLFSTLPSSRTSTAPSPVDGASAENRRSLWSKHVSSPIQFATFSPSANLIGTCGSRDRLVKIWRRLSFEEGLFDHIYLPHPGAVTHLQWRPFDELPDDEHGRHDDETEVLYTISTDAVLRVWKTGATHELEIMSLHTTVELISAIPDSPSLSTKSPALSPTASKPARYSFVIPSDRFAAAVTSALGSQTTEKLSHSLEHLTDVASREMDILVSFDGRGRMSAWGLQSVGHKRRPETPSGGKLTYHVAHAENLPLRISDGVNARFEPWFDGTEFHLVVHEVDGEVRWWKGDIEGFFSPSIAGPDRLMDIGYWSGNTAGSVTTLKASATSQELLTYNAKGDVIRYEAGRTALLEKHSTYNNSNPIMDALLLPRIKGIGGVSVTLETINSEPNLLLRDVAGRECDRICISMKAGNGDSGWQIIQSAGKNDQNRLIVLNAAGDGLICTVDGSASKFGSQITFALASKADVSLLHFAVTSNTDIDQVVGIVAISKPGSLMQYNLQTTTTGDIDQSLKSTFESGISDASILVVNDVFAAIVSTDGTTLAIVNLKDGYVEHRQALAGNIKYVEIAPSRNMIAVGYQTSVNILTQGRYEHHDDLPPWMLIKQISIAGTGLKINALTWLADGGLAFAAGNGIFISSNDVPIEELHADIREAIEMPSKTQHVNLRTIASHLTRPVSVWHPSFVAHSVRHGHWTLISSLVGRLSHKLKFWSEGDALHSLLDVPTTQLYGADAIRNPKILDPETAAELIQQLEDKDLPQVSQTEQERLKRVVQALTFCSEHINGLDNGALRFLFSWKLEVLLQSNRTKASQPNGASINAVSIFPEMHWREIAFAYHSTTQQPLLDILIEHYDNKITWDIARRLGLFAWLSDRVALEQIFESLAQSAYRMTSPPDPINASVYFLALRKKATLLGLWRIATWHKEQRATMNFLRRDFNVPENKTASKKNAYALMGRRRFDYAAAFFLLADDGASATSVLAGQCGDVMLAIAVARLFSGDNSDVTRKLLEGRLIPEAKERGDRWLLSWCYSLLAEKTQAADALVRPLDNVRSWQQDDPNTLTLYKHLRTTDSEYEYEAVLRAARILRRMGMWLLALELVSQWEFVRPTPTAKPSAPGTPNGIHVDDSVSESATSNDANQKERSSALDSLNMPTPADSEAARKAKAAELLKAMKAKKEGVAAVPIVAEKQKAEPTQFKEPDASSLLDNFGF